MNRADRIRRVTLFGAVVNVVLAFAKLACGLVARSSAMVADAIHSFSDLASDLVVLVFVRLAARPADEEHDYGHGKFETLATIGIALALLAIALGIGRNGALLAQAAFRGEELPRPGFLALVAAFVSILVKEALYRRTRHVGECLQAPVVIANAWHHRSDALSSVGTLLGIAGARFLPPAWRVLDPIAAIVVAVLILRAAFLLLRPAVDELLEKSLPAETEDEILRIVAAEPDAFQVHNLRTRRLGATIAVEFHVRVDPLMTVRSAHDITDRLEQAIRARFGEWTHVIIHVEPRRPDA